MSQPLAARMRPKCWQDLLGQQHLLAEGKVLDRAVQTRHVHSCLFWGPPGIGKTSLAQCLCQAWGARFTVLSAVNAGVKDIRNTIDESHKEDSSFICFIDEIHRFNKTQQDALLPAVESGDIILLASTTENPSFSLNNALLSRLQVYVLHGLDGAALGQLIERSLTDCVNGLGEMHLALSDRLQAALIQAADGDARQCLNLLEQLSYLAIPQDDGTHVLLEEDVSQLFKSIRRRFDLKGDYFYDQISALHKSVRGSNPDAALYWLNRMLDGGADPLYLGRRLIRMASEDIGNADPRALSLCVNALTAYQQLGSPEGDLALAQAAAYLSCAPKSNAVYMAYQAAGNDVDRYGSLDVPLHLRNAPSKLMKQLGHASGYHYAHDREDAYSPGQHYLPEKIANSRYYKPVNRGLEIKIKQKLENLRCLDQAAAREEKHDS